MNKPQDIDMRVLEDISSDKSVADMPVLSVTAATNPD